MTKNGGDINGGDINGGDINGGGINGAGGTTIQDWGITAEAAPIEKDAILLDVYRVGSDPIQGGMGRVWRVRHTGWGVDLAMKQPKAELFQNERQKANFVHECEAWINLGLHPHIVSCYYVRGIGGIPSIFSEWMDGGSLKNWIQGGRLYEGDARDVSLRVLDIAIQFARGLHYAHGQGLIHQDVKPDNLLLTLEGDAKVADFGIARARAALASTDAGAPGDATIVSASGAYTPAYCSMEQLNGEELTRRTDIYSWAVTVLEMYLGDHLWMSGAMVGHACEEYFGMDMMASMPEAMRGLLRRCLEEDPDDRPHDFAEIDAALLPIYRDAAGAAYPRESGNAAADTADSLNNKALSMLDIGKPADAVECWKTALESHPGHAQCLYNQALYLWRKGSVSDLEAFRMIPVDSGFESLFFTAMLHLERGDHKEARLLLERAKAGFGEGEGEGFRDSEREAEGAMLSRGFEGLARVEAETVEPIAAEIGLS